ncbi:RNA polymerase sigma factor [Pleionea sp. CnH1-48]|uniref:RNA polymerase sigma factor n=1 Tax=Pleionea sp. CnH1-48 TaxID=2954494 RepID=UPI002096FCE6|nr:RNA polymerase sigma factor [Pleionea sp. CnH1-48]MCO7227494.1 RNA polymerase sigma factor [Pleionea sp. CnH1-48]
MQSIAEYIKQHRSQILSVLVNHLNNWELAEDALQEACIKALQKWPTDGWPDSPKSWLLTVATRKAIDNLRHHKTGQQVIHQLEPLLSYSTDESGDDEFPDERLKLLFTCCHPALSQSAQVALTLKTICSLSTAEIASAYLTPEATMAQRLVRAKKKIRQAKIPYQIPTRAQWLERLSSVLTVIYLIFNEGYSASHGDEWIRENLCNEALDIGYLLCQLLPEEAEAEGLLALMLCHDARKNARSDADHPLIPLEHQNRSLWDKEKIHKADVLLKKALSKNRPGSFQIQAAISALHCQASSYQKTDWQQIYYLYQTLQQWQSNPVIELNSLVAYSMHHNEEHHQQLCLERLEQLKHQHPKLIDYTPFHLTHAHLLEKIKNYPAAIQALTKAHGLTSNTAEQFFIVQQQERIKKELEHTAND